MEKIVEQSLLYDFYGELLTKHQRAVYEDYVFNDIGISEIAQDRGISRQGVHDLVKRCDKILRSYEERLRLLERFEEIKTGMVLIDGKLSKISAEAGLSEEHYKDISDIRDILKGIADKL